MWSIILSILMVTLHLHVVSTSFWLTQNYFGQCIIQFVTFSENIRPFKDPPTYFYDISINNPTSPAILNHIQINVTDFLTLGPVKSMTWLNSRSGRELISVLHIDNAMIAKTLANRPMHYYIQLKITRNFNPEYIFQYTHETFNSMNYKHYFEHIGRSKIIIFNLNLPGQMFIPCITCSGSTSSQISTMPVNELDKVWWSENKNFRQRKVDGPEAYSLNEFNCDVNYVIEKNTDSGYCKIVHLSKTLNFSMVPYPNSGNQVSGLGMRNTLAKSIKALVNDPRFYEPFSVEFEYVKFSIVSQYPHALEGMVAFLLPLSGSVWIGLLVFCVAICLISQVGKEEINPTLIIKNFSVDIINTTAILLGQVNEDNLKIFTKRTSGASLVLVWLFCGRYIIMDNLYTGSIFSYLSAIQPPVVPNTIAELVDSNIPIITMSGLRSNTSILKTFIIPAQVESLKTENKSFELFLKLNAKLVFVDAYSSFVQFIQNILNLDVLTHFKASVDTSKTYALMDTTNQFKVFTDLLMANGSRLIINSKDDSPFVSVLVNFGYGNCFHALFSKKLHQLSASGIESRWPKLEQIGAAVHAMSRLYGFSYKRHFVQYVSTSADFNAPISEEESIKLKTVQSIFILCSILHVFSFISLVIECRVGLISFLKRIIIQVTYSTKYLLTAYPHLMCVQRAIKIIANLFCQILTC